MRGPVYGHPAGSVTYLGRVSWIPWEHGAKITHPTMWVWTDEDGTERCYLTKREAVEALRAERESWS